MKNTLLFLGLALIVGTSPMTGQGSRVPTYDQVIDLKRPGGVAISPDGTMAAFTVGETNWDDNAYETEIWIARSGGGAPIQLTRAKKKKSSNAPAWSPD